MSRLLSLFPSFPVVTDGAWGTELQKRGLAPGEPADLWNLSRPADVEAVARAYVEAGSRVILTNTFRSNPVSLAAHHAEGKVAEINRAGVAISKAAADGRAKVFASLGPTGKMLTAGEIDADTVTAAFTAQAEALAAGGADALLLETFSEVEEARLAIRAAKTTGLPVIASFAFDTGKNKDRTMMGTTPEQVARAVAEEGADAVGANCGAGPESFAGIARRFKEAAPELTVWIKPNAGLPVMEGGAAVYIMSPEVFVTFLPGLVEAGASFVGGCCGTSPAFIACLSRAVASCVSS
jgi:5-methyltetrahydrofolate--homocysteine methyltransferase